MGIEAGVLDCCGKIRAELGYCYSESVYHRSLEVELRNRNISYESERVVPVTYDGKYVGTVRIDLVVDGRAVVELKAVPRLLPCHEDQARKYMHLLRFDSALLVNMASQGTLEYRQIS